MRERALSRLRAAMTYWIVTARPDGRPHAAPVWGVWVDGALWFGTAGQKIRNLAHLPWAVAHDGSGEDVAIVEGPVELRPLADAPPAVAAAYRAKYVDPLSGEPFGLAADPPPSPGATLCVLRPAAGRAWLEGAFEETLTRWTEPGGGIDGPAAGA